MKILKPLACLLLPLSVSTTSLANEFSFGVGIGSLYSGLGVNVASRSATDLKYVSAGCMSYSSYGGATCGAGAGWIQADLLGFDNTNHGIGVYIGIVGDERESYNDTKAVYGAGLSYHYFAKGIEQPGAHLGISLVAGDTNSGLDTKLLLEFGYQF
ncbi:hypothetical protein [Alteromonas lipolytica]|uniref:Outer membrane protein beta-barrel domain-containing protein n=1 Tax=Alteromonas lipolytica TaxID=1856405 RepID=A0A1E8FI39_9ALTE|nr:hypothetical protein [Alteromonas lipolytica]OFI35602.1 hypothetical protein BFC17_12665 [Alteromonas lipolytica]GGF77518.1 hypothetical protein GCM10011338_32350 [Alteromonas lipolytica]